MKIYLAGPLFSEAGQTWLRGLKKIMEGCRDALKGSDLVVALPGICASAGRGHGIAFTLSVGK